jgi:hypothetical protein
MIQLANLKNLKTWIAICMIMFLLYIIISQLSKESDTKEGFVWNMGTRYIPSYDLRGEALNPWRPLVYPWNYPFFGTPLLYWSPYFYEANGRYTIDKKYAKLLNHAHRRVLLT